MVSGGKLGPQEKSLTALLAAAARPKMFVRATTDLKGGLDIAELTGWKGSIYYDRKRKEAIVTKYLRDKAERLGVKLIPINPDDYNEKGDDTVTDKKGSGGAR